MDSNVNDWALWFGLALQAARVITDIWRAWYEARCRKRGDPPADEPPFDAAA